MAGELRLSLRNPDEDRQLGRGDFCAVPPGRPHRVSNGGDISATFLVIQDGDYDYIPQG